MSSGQYKQMLIAFYELQEHTVWIVGSSIVNMLFWKQEGDLEGSTWDCREYVSLSGGKVKGAVSLKI